MKASLDTPEVSICVVSLNGHDRLHRLLDSLAEHTSQVDYEVVIVESGSRVREYTRRMNRALRAATGRIVVGLNDDVQVTPGWLEPLIAAIDAGAWVVYPDQTANDGNQCICGWCVVWSKEALYEHDLFYDERFLLWGSDIDLARRLIEAGHTAVRVAIPQSLEHQLSATVSNPDFKTEFDHWGLVDLDAYREKWGTLAQEDKYALAP